MIGRDALPLRRQKTNSWISTAFPRTYAGKAFFMLIPTYSGYTQKRAAPWLLL